MAANFWISSHCNRWLFSNEPSQIVNYDAIKIMTVDPKHRLQCVNQIACMFTPFFKLPLHPL